MVRENALGQKHNEQNEMDFFDISTQFTSVNLKWEALQLAKLKPCLLEGLLARKESFYGQA